LTDQKRKTLFLYLIKYFSAEASKHEKENRIFERWYNVVGDPLVIKINCN